MHLLAMLIEVVSVKVAGKQIKKPIDIPRPGKKKGGGEARRGASAGHDGERAESTLRPPVAPPGSTRDHGAYDQAFALLASTPAPN